MKKLFTILLVSLVTQSFAQDLAFSRKMVDTLASRHFWGRGYTREGMHKTADFLSEQFRSYGLQPLKGEDYFQHFSYSVNTFPGKMKLNINGHDLVPGKDFIVSPESRGLKADGHLGFADNDQYVNSQHRVIVWMKDTLTWSVMQEAQDYTVIELSKKAIKDYPATFELNIENEIIEDFAAANICGFVKGTVKPDSFIFITAHYDHLGSMGKSTYFPGANDNASGTAFLLNLAQWYAKHPQPYSIAFICFAGEEIGLLGSKYYTKHPLVPLTSIRFLINADITGTGDDGVSIINATLFPEEYKWVKEINDREKLLTEVHLRGKSEYSDHHYFTKKGVRCFFLHTEGGISAYHDIYDKAETLPLNEHEDLFKLVIKFNERIMGL